MTNKNKHRRRRRRRLTNSNERNVFQLGCDVPLERFDCGVGGIAADVPVAGAGRLLLLLLPGVEADLDVPLLPFLRPDVPAAPFAGGEVVAAPFPAPLGLLPALDDDLDGVDDADCAGAGKAAEEAW